MSVITVIRAYIAGHRARRRAALRTCQSCGQWYTHRRDCTA